MAWPPERPGHRHQPRQADVDGQFARFGFGGYDYKNLVVQGNLQKAYFDGHVALRDPNAKLNLDGEFDLRGLKTSLTYGEPCNRQTCVPWDSRAIR